MTDQKPPGRIYLQADSQGGYEIGRDATWCDHRIDDEDVEYVLASEPESVEPLDFAVQASRIVAPYRPGSPYNVRWTSLEVDIATALATHTKPVEPDGYLTAGDVRLIRSFQPTVPSVNVWSVADPGDFPIYIGKPTGEPE